MEKNYKWLEFIHEPEQRTVIVIGEKSWRAIMRPFKDTMSQDEIAESVHKELQLI